MKKLLNHRQINNLTAADLDLIALPKSVNLQGALDICTGIQPHGDLREKVVGRSSRHAGEAPLRLCICVGSVPQMCSISKVGVDIVYEVCPTINLFGR